MRISIEYCAIWNYEPKAVGLAEKLLKFKNKILSLELIPGNKGVFEVKIDGEKIYSKKQTGEFPVPDDILQIVRKRIKKQSEEN